MTLAILLSSYVAQNLQTSGNNSSKVHHWHQRHQSSTCCPRAPARLMVTVRYCFEMKLLMACQPWMVLAFCFANIGCSIGQCTSPQYLELNKDGIINCTFQEEKLRVLWYRTLETTKNNLIVKYWDLFKEGNGYESGEYDVLLNGSLQIKNVSSFHDGHFTVVKFKSLEYDPEQFSVVVVTTVKPHPPRPCIQGCPNKSETLCWKPLITTKISCYVEKARPPIPLQWILKTPSGERNLSSAFSVVHFDGVTSTTVATTMNSRFASSVLNLLVCKARPLPQLLDYDETSIIAEAKETNFSLVPSVQKFFKRNSQIVLPCSDTKINLIVWKKSSNLQESFTPILYGALFDETSPMRRFDSYELNSDGSLLVRHADVQHEGLYGCVCVTDDDADLSLFNISIYVPQYPAVAGCNEHQYCVLEVETEGGITCSATGIRPLVNIEVGTFKEDDASSISFTDREISINADGDVYDIQISLKYRIKETFQEKITLECRILATGTEILNSATKFDLLFTTELTSEPATRLYLLWILVLLIPLSLVSIIMVIRHAALGGPTNEENNKVPDIVSLNENIPMLSQPFRERKMEDTRNMFLKQLKGKYADLYNAVQPIPYIRDRLFCVNRVFVEGGLELLVSGQVAIGGRTWEALKSYHDIFSSPHLKSARKILEGEPGYGKSTLTLQFAYDWCNCSIQSPLKDVDILILLRLRQLGGIKSIYRAIRQFILPGDSPLTEADIKSIISMTPSTVIILDGYDEYPDKDDVETDVYSVINRKMFQDLETILTTRSSCLPHSYSAQTCRVRMTGFDGDARDLYVRKAVVDDSVAADKILQGLQENSLLADLCQVPLLFVMYAHMSHESNNTLCFNSVTSFFRHMIACFHSHMFNKMTDDNVRKYKLFEKKHKQLDDLAFDGLTGKNQTIVWPKDKIMKRIGKEFYDQYIRTGILIEEDVLDISHLSDSEENELSYRKIEVRFYHKLFHEWYAAHSLAERCRHLPALVLAKLLRHADPFDLQYFYRFACGISPKAAEKIIKHLKGTKGGDKFTVLCILEKTGDMETISDIISELCSNTIQVKNDDPTLLQRSTIQLLEIAAGNEISISRVYLNNCYSTVDLRGGNHLQLKSNLSIPVLTTLNVLVINTYDEGREITSEEFTGILQYSSKCLALKKLRFSYCLLPPYVQTDSVSVLRSRNVEVFWDPQGFLFFGTAKYQLNLQSGRWERWDSPRDGEQMTDEEYRVEASRYRQYRR